MDTVATTQGIKARGYVADKVAYAWASVPEHARAKIVEAFWEAVVGAAKSFFAWILAKVEQFFSSKTSVAVA
jgi:hypothetical protein